MQFSARLKFSHFFSQYPNGAGSDGECSAGGQACSRAIQYHEFLPGQTPIHIHEYCECN